MVRRLRQKEQETRSSLGYIVRWSQPGLYKRKGKKEERRASPASSSIAVLCVGRNMGLEPALTRGPGAPAGPSNCCPWGESKCDPCSHEPPSTSSQAPPLTGSTLAGSPFSPFSPAPWGQCEERGDMRAETETGGQRPSRESREPALCERTGHTSLVTWIPSLASTGEGED